MIWLSISIIALILGVLCSTLLHQKNTWNSLLHGFVIGFIGLLLFVEILPHAHFHIGWSSLLWFALGFVVITGIDYISSGKKAWLSIGLLSLVFGLHALIDGVALGTQREGTLLAIAIVTHRFPEGLAIAGKAETPTGKWILLGVMVVTSIIGYFSVQQVPIEALSTLQALAGGGLAHVLLHAHLHADNEEHSIDTCTSVDLRSWRIGGFFSSVGAYLLIHLAHTTSIHSPHMHNHETNLSLLTLVGMALFALVWIEKEHVHH